jgi:hypothetical protein
VSDRVVEIVAKKIIALAKAGEQNPDALCERALAELGQVRPHDVVAGRSSQIQR